MKKILLQLWLCAPLAAAQVGSLSSGTLLVPAGAPVTATTFPGADIGAQINAAYAAMCNGTNTGGTVQVPVGIFSVSTPIVITQTPGCSFTLQGFGAAAANSGAHSATILQASPALGANPVISITGTNTSGVVIRDINFDNTGTSTMAILASGNDIKLERVTCSRPTIPFSVAGSQWGIDQTHYAVDGTIESSHFDTCAPVNLYVPSAQATINIHNSHFTQAGGQRLISSTDTWSLGTGWSGTFSTGFVQTAGNATAVTDTTFVPTIGQSFQINYTLSGVTGGTVTPSVGGVTGPSASINGNYTWITTAAVSSANLSFTSDASFAGTVKNMHLIAVTPNGVHEIVLGTPTSTAIGVTLSQSSIEGGNNGIPNEADVEVIRANTFSIDQGYAEIQTGGYVVECGSTAQFCQGINVTGTRLSCPSTKCSAAMHSNFGSASWGEIGAGNTLVSFGGQTCSVSNVSSSGGVITVAYSGCPIGYPFAGERVQFSGLVTALGAQMLTMQKFFITSVSPLSGGSGTFAINSMLAGTGGSESGSMIDVGVILQNDLSLTANVDGATGVDSFDAAVSGLQGETGVNSRGNLFSGTTQPSQKQSPITLNSASAFNYNVVNGNGSPSVGVTFNATSPSAVGSPSITGADFDLYVNVLCGLTAGHNCGFGWFNGGIDANATLTTQNILFTDASSGSLGNAIQVAFDTSASPGIVTTGNLITIGGAQTAASAAALFPVRVINGLVTASCVSSCSTAVSSSSALNLSGGVNAANPIWYDLKTPANARETLDEATPNAPARELLVQGGNSDYAATGTGAVRFNMLGYSGTGGVIFGSGSASSSSGIQVASISNSGSGTFAALKDTSVTSAGALKTDGSGNVGAATVAGAGSGLTTGPTSATSGNFAQFTGTGGQIADSGVANTNTLGCLDGYDHLPCLVAKIADTTVTISSSTGTAAVIGLSNTYTSPSAYTTPNDGKVHTYQFCEPIQTVTAGSGGAAGTVQMFAHWILRTSPNGPTPGTTVSTTALKASNNVAASTSCFPFNADANTAVEWGMWGTSIAAGTTNAVEDYSVTLTMMQ